MRAGKGPGRLPPLPTLKLLSAPPEAGEQGPEGLVARLRESFDYCLMDYPGGLDSAAQAAAALADRVLVVATTDPCSHRDAEKTAQVLRREGAADIYLLMNRVKPRLLSAAGLTLDDSMDRVGLRLIGYVPEDPRVSLALNAGKPLLAADRRPLRGAAAAFRRIAKRLDGQRVPIRK